MSWSTKNQVVMHSDILQVKICNQHSFSENKQL